MWSGDCTALMTGSVFHLSCPGFLLGVFCVVLLISAGGSSDQCSNAQMPD